MTAPALHGMRAAQVARLAQARQGTGRPLDLADLVAEASHLGHRSRRRPEASVAHATEWLGLSESQAAVILGRQMSAATAVAVCRRLASDGPGWIVPRPGI